jgi:hypothetical protein
LTIARVPPWIAFVLFFAWRFRRFRLHRRRYRKAWRSGTGSSCSHHRFAIHYLFPFSLFAALALSGLAAQRASEDRFAPRLALTSLAIALLIFLLKLGSFYVVPPASEATHLLPYDRLAEELRQRGLGQAQFVTLSPRDAGNLAVALPERGRCL